MSERQFCQSCGQRRDCRQIYVQMGSAKGPSIALSIFLVFLLPIAVFIAGLAISQMTFAGLMHSSMRATLSSVLFAAAMSFVVILVVRNKMKRR